LAKISHHFRFALAPSNRKLCLKTGAWSLNSLSPFEIQNPLMKEICILCFLYARFRVAIAPPGKKLIAIF
jgi:hypothetical protein